MAKSLVEKYEQILVQDPASTVFVELAKALIEKGDHARAIEVCQQGLGHHSDSVVGRVLWGKALINLGRPAEAMEQFDKAIATDRDNPHAYNLISEVLLHKGLYRSALPLLKKAVALQPNDGRLRQWVEQTQAALAGGPAPILGERSRLETPLELPASDGEATEVSIPAYVPGTDVEGVAVTAENPVDAAVATGPMTSAMNGAPARTQTPSTPRARVASPTNGAPPRTQTPSTPESRVTSPNSAVAAPASAPGRTISADLPVFDPGALAPDAPDDPFSAVPARSEPVSEEVVAGLTGTFDALSKDAQTGSAPVVPPVEDPFDAVTRRSKSTETADVDHRGETVPLRVPAAPPGPTSEPSIAVSTDLYQDGRVEHHDPKKNKPEAEGLLGAIPDAGAQGTATPAAPAQGQGARAGQAQPQAKGQRPQQGRPAAPPVLAGPGATAAAGPSRGAKRPASSDGGGLLGDIPDLEPVSALDLPKVEVSTHAAEAIAREYERELREKLAQSKAKKSFLSRHWIKIAAGAVTAVVIAVGVAMYDRTYSQNQGSIQDVLATAKKAILQDTRASYVTAVDALGRATKMDEDSAEAWALTGYAHAVLYSEYGGRPENKQLAQTAIARPGVKEKFEGLGLAVRYHLSDAAARTELAKAIVAYPADEAEVDELAGRILLSRGEEKQALDRFQQALADQATNARVLVALGDYYRAAGDYPKALEFYKSAGEISPAHVGRTLGAAETRLVLKQELQLSANEVKALPPDEELGEELRARKALAAGRVLAATGEGDEGLALLKAGLATHTSHAYEFQLALGEAARNAGRMADAEHAYEAALKLQPQSEDAREGLARVLIDRERPKDATSRIAADPKSRRISLVRGVAFAKLQDWKRARVELERTQVGGKFPSEAVVYLALADSAEGDPVKGRELLEKLAGVTKKARSELLVALGNLHLSRGELDKAKARFEEASKEPDDVEGACAYGRLLLQLGFPELAVDPLYRAARRNDSHAEAHEALTRSFLQIGKVAEALEVTGKWLAANPTAAAHRLNALALYQAVKLKEADRAATAAIKADNDVAEAWRIRAKVNFAQGDHKGGFRDLERANKLDPKDADTFCEIGLAFLRQGNSQHAQAAYQAALREKPDASCGKIGLLYARLPSGAKATAKSVEPLIREAPSAWDKAFGHATHAEALLALGRSKDAKEAAEAAVKLAPWSGTAFQALGLAQQKLKEPEAKDTLARAVALDPVHGGIRLAYADLLARGTDADQAKALYEYERFLQIGGDDGEVKRVERTLKALKKRLASR